jgi:N-acetylmuramoyl-L-alanine amidase
MDKILFYLDPGHGGVDSGCTGNGLIEKVTNLIIAKKVGSRLQNYENVEVRYTRETDVYVSLNDRAKMANSSGATFFLSLHSDANANTEANGATSYRHPNASNRTKAIQDLIHIEYSKVLTKYDIANRGCRTANFAVLRETSMSAILLENLFITNAKDAEKLKSDAFLNDLADGIVNGLVRAFSLEKKQSINDLKSDVSELQKVGIIGSPEYWLSNAMTGKQCNGEYVSSLIKKMSSYIQLK